MSIALELSGVAKRYVAGLGGCIASVSVLRGVDLTVRSGDVVAVVGPSGSGKSTLLLAAAGLLVPDRGEIRWFGDPSRAAAVRHALYRLAGSLASVRASVRAPVDARIHLVDDPDMFGAADAARFARWVARRRAAGESILIATRHRATALALATRVVVLAGGTLHADVIMPAPRVAEAHHGRIVPGAGD